MSHVGRQVRGTAPGNDGKENQITGSMERQLIRRGDPGKSFAGRPAGTALESATVNKQSMKSETEVKEMVEALEGMGETADYWAETAAEYLKWVLEMEESEARIYDPRQ